MPTKERLFNAKLEEFLELKSKQRRSEQTIKDYRWLLRKTLHQMKEGGREMNPKWWTEDDVNWIRDHAYAHLEPGVARRQFSILADFANFCGNTVIRDMHMEWPRDRRIHVDWLTPQEAIKVMEVTEGIERIVIHLQLCLGLRRVEVLRMKISDIKLGYVNILGKGKMGGKRRTSPFHRDTAAELEHYFRIRDHEIAKARTKNPAVPVPDSLLIYERAGQLHAYKRSFVDKLIARVAVRIGTKFTNHTLRRTFGRLLWLAGVPLETIKEILGHEDTKTTILYLGLNMDDKSDAMNKLADFMDAQKKANSGGASKKSGQSGISAHEMIWLTPDSL